MSDEQQARDFARALFGDKAEQEAEASVGPEESKVERNRRIVEALHPTVEPETEAEPEMSAEAALLLAGPKPGHAEMILALHPEPDPPPERVNEDTDRDDGVTAFATWKGGYQPDPNSKLEPVSDDLPWGVDGFGTPRTE
jgi:hypothetical protein